MGAKGLDCLPPVSHWMGVPGIPGVRKDFQARSRKRSLPVPGTYLRIFASWGHSL